MNIVKKTNQKNLGFRKSNELKINTSTNNAVFSDIAIHSLGLTEEQSVSLGIDNGKVFLVTLNDKSGFTIKGNNLNNRQFCTEVVNAFPVENMNNCYAFFTIGNVTMIDGMNCREISFKETKELTIRTKAVVTTTV